MRRNSSTIPFGYKLASDDKTLVPVAKEIESLNEMKDGVKSGAFSLRGAVDILDNYDLESNGTCVRAFEWRRDLSYSYV